MRIEVQSSPESKRAVHALEKSGVRVEMPILGVPALNQGCGWLLDCVAVILELLAHEGFPALSRIIASLAAAAISWYPSMWPSGPCSTMAVATASSTGSLLYI